MPDKPSDYSTNLGKINTINDLFDIQNDLKEREENGAGFLFRGQEKKDHNLENSLDRFYKKLKLIDDSIKKEKVELFLLDEFQRRFHNYSQRIPAYTNFVEWWAIMQHYGAPTRLIDWTYSLNVAVFMAIEDLKLTEKESEFEEAAIWAIDHKWLLRIFEANENNTEIRKSLDNGDPHLENLDNFEKFSNGSNILRICPTFLNERLSVQQGCFLLPSKIDKAFYENLIDFAGGKEKLKEGLFHIEIGGSPDSRKKLLAELYRMNISRASLFPGIDGFAESLKTIPFAIPNLVDKPVYEFDTFCKQIRNRGIQPCPNQS